MITISKPKLTVPGPRFAPVFGRIAQTINFVSDSVGVSSQLFKAYGSVVSLVQGGGTNVYSPHANCPGTVVAYGPDIVREVTTQHNVYHKCPLIGSLYSRRNDSERTEPFGHFLVGLFGVNNDLHRQHRQLLMPAFHKQRIESYRDDMVKIVLSELEQLKVGEVVNIAEFMQRLTMRVATKTLFGKDVNEDNGNLIRLLKRFGKQLTNPLSTVLPIDFPGFPYHNLLNAMQLLDEEMRSIIRERYASSVDGGDIISMLVQAKDAESGLTLSEDELLGHVTAIFVAGHDTSANELTWILFLLSQHPDIAADLLDELENVLGGEAPTVEKLQKLPLLDRVVKESLRVLTSIPWNGRVTSQPTTLGGYELPAGTEVWVSIYHTHQMPEIYPEPERFLPQRWETIQPTMYEYNPFSTGSRVCIGAGFAMMEIKIVLAMLLMRYRLQLITEKPVNAKGFIVMAPENGMFMKVHKQDRQFNQGVGGVSGNIRKMVNLID
ncbi:cytochrome P450 [Calothrix sp. HK-06]|nr:cytochrome P450 [Calothrix sp. HK-06]